MPDHDHVGHRKRLKKRFREEGLDHFELHNVVELLLFYSIPQGDTNDLAHTLMKRFGSLSGIFNASYEDLMAVKGVGENTATLLKLIPQVCRRYFREEAEIPRPSENYVEDLGRRLVAEYVGRRVETVFLFCFDNKMKELYFGMLGEGTLDTVNILVRQVVEIAVRVGASNVVLAHNHPNGLALPSREDQLSTIQLRQTLGDLSIHLLDHIIVAGDDFCSMAQSSAFAEFFPVVPPDPASHPFRR